MVETAIALSVKILGGMAVKLLTERFLSRLIVLGLRECAKRTANTWDDELAKVVQEEVAPDMAQQK